VNKHLIVGEAKKLPGVNSWHEFGGQHTELKLWVVENYLKRFAAALKRYFSELWFIDAFAGTGCRTVRHEARESDLFGAAVPERIEQRRGSAQIAIDVTPQFDRLVFMESKPSYCAVLRELAQQYSDRKIVVVEDDANRAIQTLIKRGDWRRTRAVMFLDPYGMEVEWATLEAVAATKSIDVWFLFPLSGPYRQATLRSGDIDDSKRLMVSEIRSRATPSGPLGRLAESRNRARRIVSSGTPNCKAIEQTTALSFAAVSLSEFTRLLEMKISANRPSGNREYEQRYLRPLTSMSKVSDGRLLGNRRRSVITLPPTV
jgi:three-Cys-motif partner protein